MGIPHKRRTLMAGGTQGHMSVCLDGKGRSFTRPCSRYNNARLCITCEYYFMATRYESFEELNDLTNLRCTQHVDVAKNFIVLILFFCSLKI